MPTDSLRMARIHPGHNGPPPSSNVIPEPVQNRVNRNCTYHTQLCFFANLKGNCLPRTTSLNLKLITLIKKRQRKVIWRLIKLSYVQLSLNLSCNPNDITNCTTKPWGLGIKIFSGFSSQYVSQLFEKKVVQYFLHFEAISIYVCPILKWSPCNRKTSPGNFIFAKKEFLQYQQEL